MKTVARKLLFSLTENLWTAGFALAGRQRHPVQPWTSPGGHHILALAPHPDDEVAGCGGTLVRHHHAGDTTHLLFVTDGRASRAGGLSPHQMAERRASEAQESARALEITHVHWLGLPENDWPLEHLLQTFHNLFEKFPISLIYAPSRVDFHPEHHKVAHGLALALRQMPDPPLVRAYQLHVPLGNLANLVCPIPEGASPSRAIRAYASQWGSLERVFRMWQYSSASYRQPYPVEVFWEMPGSTYVRLHQDPLPWPENLFRGLRPRPFTDPLAYIVGNHHRKTLKISSQ
ncbi:MAG TPA: PIG-L family deacetylase [Anaerolineales bacterium]|nr:PIG-L family deacetylase [Anaerolineales bacterium]